MSATYTQCRLRSRRGAVDTRWIPNGDYALTVTSAWGKVRSLAHLTVSNPPVSTH